MKSAGLERAIKRAVLRSGLIELPAIRRRLNPLGYTFKRMLLRDTARQFQCKTFVETGTYFGETSRYMARFVEQVLTCEPDPRLYEHNLRRNRRVKNISIWNKGSEECFAEMLRHVTGRPLFWLDGHYSGEGTTLTSNHTPILQELSSIQATGAGGVVAIDDVREFESLQNVLKGTFEKGYPKIETVVELLRTSLPENQLTIVGDCLLSLPSSFPSD
jgi:hypothetical protein